MKFKELAEKLADQAAYPLATEVLERTGKARHHKDDKEIKTFVLWAQTHPKRALYRKNLRTEPATFLEAEVPPLVLENIQQKLRAK
jgi:hypothetical protein